MEKQKVIKDIVVSLQVWFSKNQRVLPWRMLKDPYAIWISETMLQQTTTQAVRPFYERFMERFPTLQSLAEAEQSEVLEKWAGLGYYSRARNLHAAAKTMAIQGIPRTHELWLELPGVGPYTARAVSSLSFGEKVGVIDGNVIRILSRIFGLKLEWWKTAARNQLQEIADEMVKFGDPSIINQAMMELGALVCSPKNPACMTCPCSKNCVALKEDRVLELPLKKKPQDRTILHWKPFVVRRADSVALIQNSYAPFLKNQWLYPGQCEIKKSKPKSFRFCHFITQYDIYVSPERLDPKHIKNLTNVKWVNEHQLKSINPSSLLQKVQVSTPLLGEDIHA